MTVDYYSAPNGTGPRGAGGPDDLVENPALRFRKAETYGYSRNGKRFIVPAGSSFAGIADESPASGAFIGTAMSIIHGENRNSLNVYDGRSTVADVNTGWTGALEMEDRVLRSDVLSLWGISDLSHAAPSEVVLRLTYAGNGPVRVVRKADGAWIDAGSNMQFDASARVASATVTLAPAECGEFAVAAVK